MPRTSDEARAHLRYAVSRQLQAGHSQRSIARSLGISRKTVKKLEKELEQRREDGHSVMDELATGRTPRSSMLDPHIETICTWLEEARRKRRHLTATRILERLQKEQDFKGQYTIVAECVRELRKKIAPQPVTAVRHTYPPGQRAEFDWSPYQLTDELTVQTWHAVLCWSRVPSLEGWLRTTQQTIFGCLVRSFERWEGVPEECVTDTMPGVVDGWECDRPILNARMVDFAAHYGFAVRVARRATPKDKPRVERRFRYHEDDLLGGAKDHDAGAVPPAPGALAAEQGHGAGASGVGSPPPGDVQGGAALSAVPAAHAL